MTLKYPIGTQTFSKIIEEGMVYVDKTDLVYQLAQKQQVFLSRPRRFGKSLTLSTLDAYFSGQKELFEGLKIVSMEEKWTKHEVLRIDFNGGMLATTDGLQKDINTFFAHYCPKYNYVFDPQLGNGGNLRQLILQVKEQSGQQVVILVDEYDKPLLDCLDNEEQYERNRVVLRDLYSAFKASDADLRFIMLTGVTKFTQVNIFSGLNQLEDISMYKVFECLCGITEEELCTQFEEPIKTLAQENDMSVNETKEMLRTMYDGYHFSANMIGIYNPFSILSVFISNSFEQFWLTTGDSMWLVELMQKVNVDIQEMLQNEYSAEQFSNYRTGNDMLPLLYQSGYLTITDVKRIGGRLYYSLDFPNGEVKEGFFSLLVDQRFGLRSNQTRSFIEKIQRYLLFDKTEEMMQAMQSFFSSIEYSANQQEQKQYESHFQYTFYLLIRLMTAYFPRLEQQTSQGRIDLLIPTDKHIYIFEFKLDGKLEEAMQQIEERGYAKPYLNGGLPITKIGVLFSSTTRTIEDWGIA